ncbi:Chromosome transmission fidelity protein 18-like protein [Acropora cervicornis]|uniref:Chromosome transmission fidelity protein 18-like protein n=1 Tax=Acropora cervicornis TaxID=6130 RepID=A0AAD9V7Q5_ACRCE|nr:Chromosome transmission fidelity protein 18-like protein [Acropora cervicornis]
MFAYMNSGSFVLHLSDDRSPEIFRNTLEASTQMKSVLGYNEKPNCLVIDEIDGAPAPAINVLLSVIKQKDSHAASAKETKRKKKASPLSRPIICICNDHFTLPCMMSPIFVVLIAMIVVSAGGD